MEHSQLYTPVNSSQNTSPDVELASFRADTPTFTDLRDRLVQQQPHPITVETEDSQGSDNSPGGGHVVNPRDVPIELDKSSFISIAYGYYRLLQSRINNYLFPADVPKEIQLWRWDNIAIPCCYLLVGTYQGLSSSILNTYPIQIGATEAQQTTVKILRSLPASFKIIYGFISDGFPIMGYRRKWYMAIGWAVASAACFALGMLERPSIDMLSLLVFVFGNGFWFADVVGDSLVAEKAKLEPVEHRGQLQSLCYACRFFMLMVSVTFSTLLYEYFPPKIIFYILGTLPILIMFPTIYLLKERISSEVVSIKAQCNEMWSAVCSRAVWQPMGFVYLYNLLQIGNGAWNQFLYSGLKFSTFELNSFLIEAYALTFFGILFYKSFLRNVSWRAIYVSTTLMNSFFSILQFLLIFGINRKFGITDYLFALGDDVFAEFVLGIQFLPTTIMMVHLCPVGSEGAAYAMFTTVNNAALNLSGTISTALLGIWNVCAKQFEESPPVVDGLWRLSLLTTLLQTSGLLLIPLLPHGQEQLKSLNFQNRSVIGGGIFVGILCISLLWSLVVAFLNIYSPDWMGTDKAC